MTFYVVLGLSAFLLSLLGTRLSILTLRSRIHPLDLHRAKTLQKELPAPHGGGLAVLFSLIISLLVADMHYGIVLSLFLLAAIALLGEFLEIPGFIRLLVQVMSVAIPISMSNTPLLNGLLPMLPDKIFTGLLWLVFINLFMGMDKLEGISATEIISIGLGTCLIIGFSGHWPHYLFTSGMIVAAAGAGFLWWNWYPAKVWLGDAGSSTLGFLAFYLLWQLDLHGYEFAAAILPAYYVADGLLSAGSHLIRKKELCFKRCHFYHEKAIAGGMKRDEAMRYIFGVNILLIFLASRSALDEGVAVIYLGVAYMAVFMLLGFFAHAGKTHEQ